VVDAVPPVPGLRSQATVPPAAVRHRALARANRPNHERCFMTGMILELGIRGWLRTAAARVNGMAPAFALRATAGNPPVNRGRRVGGGRRLGIPPSALRNPRPPHLASRPPRPPPPPHPHLLLPTPP